MKAEDFRISKLGKATIASPIRQIEFISDEAAVAYDSDPHLLAQYLRRGVEIPAFEQAGPRAKIYHDPAWTKAAILTAGGLCPGLNDVIKFLTRTLRIQYGVPLVYGIRYGYRGLNPDHKLQPILLDDANTDDIHESGGTILGSSRGAEDPVVMVDTLARMNINVLFCIGGDGTARGAHDIAQEAARRGLSISVIAIPKTIDNDIAFIDKSFGFETAVYMAGMFATGAHSEANPTSTTASSPKRSSLSMTTGRTHCCRTWPHAWKRSITRSSWWRKAPARSSSKTPPLSATPPATCSTRTSGCCSRRRSTTTSKQDRSR